MRIEKNLAKHGNSWEVGVYCPVRRHWVWRALDAKTKRKAEKVAPAVFQSLLMECAELARAKAEEFSLLALKLSAEVER